jgi:type IV pilus assembly protein PilB
MKIDPAFLARESSPLAETLGAVPAEKKWTGDPAQRLRRRPVTSTEAITGFVERLVQNGIVSASAVQSAIARKRHGGDADRRHVFQVLIDEFGADREQVYAEFTRYYSFKSIDPSTMEATTERYLFINRTTEALPPKLRDLAAAVKILPYQLAEGDATKLQLVTPDPTNPYIPTVARAFPYAKHEVCYISLKNYEDLSRALIVDNQSRPSEKSIEFIDDEFDTPIDELDEEIRRGHLLEVVDNLFSDAVRVNSSDIHVIPKGARRTEVYFRIDGRLSLWQVIEDLRADAVSAVIKDVTKGPDRFERQMAQDGYIQKTIDNKIVRFRVSIIPIIGKELKVKLESIVIRVLRDPEASITVENIGFAPAALERFREAIAKPHGIIVLTGPTGSGKSTTLLAALRAVMDPSLNVITVEDPVEYFIDGARQVKLNPKLDFEGALRAILRHDPDIVMVGEIRDRITADLAVKLANTGHLTFTTLHTNDAPSAIARLYKMGVEPFLLAYSINIIVAQRLVRVLCPRCKAPKEDLPAEALRKLGLTEADIASTTFYGPVGCIHCYKGFKGRTAIHETLPLSPEIRQIIMESGDSIQEQAIRRVAVAQGMKTLREAGVELLKKGVTSFEEIASTTTENMLAR